MERIRCTHCRNPIKPHQDAAGPVAGDRSYHQDCWEVALQDGTTPVAQQRAYEKRIAEDGLSGLLSPYVCVLPHQRSTAGPVLV